MKTERGTRIGENKNKVKPTILIGLLTNLTCIYAKNSRSLSAKPYGKRQARLVEISFESDNS